MLTIKQVLEVTALAILNYTIKTAITNRDLVHVVDSITNSNKKNIASQCGRSCIEIL